MKTIKEIANEVDFYFEELEKAFNDFENSAISHEEIDSLINSIKSFYDGNKEKDKFITFIEENPEHEEILNLIGKIISMSDLNAANKEKFNPYDDKRVIAKAGVRQNDWVVNLLNYKKSGLDGVSNPDSSIRAAIEFIKDPKNNLTALSINHKKLISRNLLKKIYKKETFVSDIKRHFSDEINNLEIKNPKNKTIILGKLIYSEKYKSIWISEEEIEAEFKNWMLNKKKLASNTFNKYTGKLKTIIPKQLINIEFKDDFESLYLLEIDELKEIQELFNNNDYGLQEWNKSKKINREASNALALLIEFFENNDEAILSTSSSSDEGVNKDMSKSNNPLNQILFGPPGTGKTYNTINKALAAIYNIDPSPGNEERFASSILAKAEKQFEEKFWESENTDRKKLVAIYKRLIAENQIVFVTFHQSYGYEEFVEGIKAITASESENDDGTTMIYKVVPGTFKRLCELEHQDKVKEKTGIEIENDACVWKVSLGGARENYIKKQCFKEKSIRIGWPNIRQLNIEDKEFAKESAKTQTTLKYFEEIMKDGDFVVSLYDNKHIDAIGIITGEYEWDETNSEFPRKRNVKWIWIKDKDPINFHKINKKNMSQQTVYRLWNIEPNDLLSLIESESEQINITTVADKNYVLIIDEINRGNISKIFGELITLIEPSKRIGADEELRVNLPYSGKPFGVPKNLYIIGTMNTADRSIAPIDTALRRRFEFEEMLPKPELLSNEKLPNNITGVDLQQVLTAINARIEYLYDRDHTIGHSYFMDVTDLESLRSAFKNKIIPLLAEYFYEDWENIDLVLNKNGFIQEKKNENGYIEGLAKQIQGKKVYEITSEEGWGVDRFKKIYGGDSSQQGEDE